MYLIDGYNLMYATDIETREDLIDKVNQFCLVNKKYAEIIFDGYSDEREDTSCVKVVYSGDADEKIKDILKANSNPSAIMLITSDRELIYSARQNKIKVIKSEDFNFSVPEFVKVDRDEDPDLQVSDGEVEHLLEEFKNRSNLSS